jgi:hypothetical protein
VLFADRSMKAELDHASQITGSSVRTARVIAEIFREFFFAAVWSCKPRFNGYPRRSKPLHEHLHYVRSKGVLCK